MRRYLTATALMLASPLVAGSMRGQEPLPPVGGPGFGAPVTYSSTYTEESRLRKWWRSTRRDTQRNNFWFDSFVPADRCAVRNPMALQVANGWRLQNTIDEHYFEEDTSRLTVAGEAKIRNILELTEFQEEFRTIYVQRAVQPEITVARIAAVQEAARRFLPAGVEPCIEETNRTLRGWPAQYVDDIDTQFRETTPPPRIPEYQRADGGGGGGAASGS